MGDIHVLDGDFRGNASGVFKVAYHVPNAETNFPGGVVSVVPGISQAESDAILAGTIVEVIKYIPVNNSKTVTVLKDIIRQRWASVAAETQSRISTEYRFYGNVLTRSP